jgi:hypothetical protein
MEPLKAVLAGVIDKTRPMDNMPLTFEAAQEDELATNQLSAGTSPYMPIVMMGQQRKYWDYFTFQGASEGVTAALKRWQKSLLYFLQKVQYHAGPSAARKRFLLKSPVHTARVKILLEMFPDAQFIYIYRNPYTVFQSAANMADKTYWYTYLATPSRSDIQSFIVDQYNLLFEEYQAAKKLIPPGNLFEIKYEDFSADKIGSLKRMYKHLGWENFDEGGDVAQYVETIQSFKKNRHSSLTPEMKAYVHKQWKRSFEVHGYDA